MVEILHGLVCGCNCFLVLRAVFHHILFYIVCVAGCFCFVLREKLLTLFDLQSRTKFIGNQILMNEATLKDFWVKGVILDMLNVIRQVRLVLL